MAKVIQNKESPFPDDIVTAAQAAMKETRCPASVSLAQWALESGYGKYMPPLSNNPFGIKFYPGCPYEFVECETKEYIPANKGYQEIIAKFIKYPSIEIGFLEHAKLLTQTEPFKSYFCYIDDIFKWVPRISKSYATDPGYSNKILSLIQEYQLQIYDKVV